MQLLRTPKHVILSGVRSTESKNLRIMMTFAVKSVPRSFDSLALAQDDKLGRRLDKLKFDLSTDKSTAKRRCFQKLLYDSLYPAYFLTVSSILVLTKAARSAVFRSLYSS